MARPQNLGQMPEKPQIQNPKERYLKAEVLVKLTLKRYHGIFENRIYSGKEMREDYVATRTTKKALMPPLDHQELREEGRKPETEE